MANCIRDMSKLKSLLQLLAFIENGGGYSFDWGWEHEYVEELVRQGAVCKTTIYGLNDKGRQLCQQLGVEVRDGAIRADWHTGEKACA